MSSPASRPFPRANETGLPVQVAAVCYRVRRSSLEILLVNTSAGKWTFPKGRTDPSLSGSESAAREALEEAGAKGRIEEQHFGSYLDKKRVLGPDSQVREIMVAVYLFEVRSMISPEEDGRNPTWFAPHEAKKRLAERRAPKYSGQITRIIDTAVELVASVEPRLALPEPARSPRFNLQR
jgi:8-oxo-dGTP pyrophosphatase MutT (NUDIX family)